MINLNTSFITLPYNVPVPVRGRILTENRYLKVELLSEEYFLSVLPGFHEATLEEIRFKLLHFFSHHSPDFSRLDFNKRFFNTVAEDDFLKTIKNETLYHIECLLLAMIKKTHPELFSSFEMKVNDLYSEKLGPAYYKKTECLKIKIAPDSVVKTGEVMNELFENNHHLKFRLDGNRQFELSELIAFENTLKKTVTREAFCHIDYVEEPFKNFYDSYLFQKRSALCLATDESFSPENSFLNFPAVVKPSLFGISPIYNWMQTHSKNRMIVSSSYEHSNVRIGLVFLAGLRPSEFHGLPSL